MSDILLTIGCLLVILGYMKGIVYLIFLVFRNDDLRWDIYIGNWIGKIYEFLGTCMVSFLLSGFFLILLSAAVYLLNKLGELVG